MTRTVYVTDQEIWHAARIAANATRQSLGAIVEAALIAYLRDTTKTCPTCEKIRTILK